MNEGLKKNENVLLNGLQQIFFKNAKSIRNRNLLG